MVDQMQEKPITPEDEIRELERRLEEKKQELAGKGDSATPEREIFREVIREKIASTRPPSYAAPASGVSSAPTTPTSPASDLKKHEEREADIRALVEIALTRGIESAVRYAEKESPYLLDELHDRLVDDYYEKLIALRKLKAL